MLGFVTVVVFSQRLHRTAVRFDRPRWTGPHLAMWQGRRGRRGS